MTDLDKMLADAAGSAKAARGWAMALENIGDLRPEDVRDAARAIRGFVQDVEAMADIIERLARERDALAKTLELLLSESPPRAVPCVDHPVLDVLAKAITPQFQHLGPDCIGPAEDVTRESECVEFRDPATGQRFEIIVRPIPDSEDRP